LTMRMTGCMSAGENSRIIIEVHETG
jgi:hypothetical protein